MSIVQWANAATDTLPSWFRPGFNVGTVLVSFSVVVINILTQATQGNKVHFRTQLKSTVHHPGEVKARSAWSCGSQSVQQAPRQQLFHIHWQLIWSVGLVTLPLCPPHSEGTLLFFTVLSGTSQTSLVGRSSCQECDPFPISPRGEGGVWHVVVIDPGTNTLPPFFTIDLCAKFCNWRTIYSFSCFSHIHFTVTLLS